MLPKTTSGKFNVGIKLGRKHKHEQDLVNPGP